MSDEFDEIFDELMADDEEDTTPTYRVTVRNRKLTLTHWAPFLAQGGAWNAFFDARKRAGVAIADLIVSGEDADEVLVRFHSTGKSEPEAEEAICDWARRLGYKRVWLTDHLVELEPDPEELGRAEVRCSTCGSRWHDSTPEFWLTVRKQGAFPKWCLVCGCELPQWTVPEAASRAESESTQKPAAGGRQPGRTARNRAERWTASGKPPRRRQEKS